MRPFLFLIVIIICGTHATARAKDDVLTPKQVFENMQRHLDAGDYEKYLACMTKHGKGWTLNELTTGLLWGAYANPINSDNGKPYRELLAKYDLDDLTLRFVGWKRQGLTSDEALRRLSDHVGDRQVQFFRDYRKLMPSPPPDKGPPNLKIKQTTISRDRVKLTLVTEEGFKVDYLFVRQGNVWLCDGHAPEQEGK